MRVYPVFFPARLRFDPIWTARPLVATRRNIASSENVSSIHLVYGLHRVPVEQHVIVPDSPIAMPEKCDVSQLIVIVDYICQIHGCLPSMVAQKVRQGRIGVVNDIYLMLLNVLQVVKDPLYALTFAFQSSNDNCRGNVRCVFYIFGKSPLGVLQGLGHETRKVPLIKLSRSSSSKCAAV